MIVRFGREANMRWRPTFAPWRTQEVLICERPGVPLPAGAPFEVPDAIAYAALADFGRLSPALDPVYENVPDASILAAQREAAIAAAPHVFEDHPSWFPEV